MRKKVCGQDPRRNRLFVTEPDGIDVQGGKNTKQFKQGALLLNDQPRPEVFDMGWIMAIEDTARRDWYESLHRRLRVKT